jgi:regulator of nucleoside diphosphate kinase
MNLSYARRLQNEIAHADVIPSQEISHDVVTMRSQVRFRDLDTGDESVYTIVFPSEADLDAGKISILAPLAASLLGYRRGDIVRFEAPTRVRQLQILEIIYQPESSGHFDL